MLSLHRKHRPQTVDQLDQAKVRQALKHLLKSGQFGQAYLFTGPKGTGKTSSARILAKILNCETNSKALDQGKSLNEPCNKCELCQAINSGTSQTLLEIDGASNRKIDDVRALREQVSLIPTQGKYSVYIIDEVHMLTTEAFNALLKTLEEPPAHVVFCLCTTELHKLPGTIVSRCTVVEFGLSDQPEILRSLERVAEAEKLQLDPKAAELIAQAADGSFRDAMNILQSVMSLGNKIGIEEVNSVVFQTDTKQINQLFENILAGRTKEALSQVAEAVESGTDVSRLSKELLSLAMDRVRDQLSQSGQVNQEYLTLVEVLGQTFRRFGQVPIASLPLEMAIVEYGVKRGTTEIAEKDITEGTEKEGGGTGESIAVNSKIVDSITENREKVNSKIENSKTGNSNIVDSTKENRGKVNSKIENSAEVDGEKESKDSEELKESEAVSGATSSVQILLTEVQSKWRDVLDQVSNHNHGLVTVLNRGKLVSCEDNILQISVAYKFHKEQLEQERYLKVIESAITQVLGSSLKCEVVLNPNQSAPKKLDKHSNISGQIPKEDQKMAEVVEEAFGL